MAFYRVTLYESAPPPDLENTTVVYCEAPDPAELLCVAFDAHNKPIKEYEEITEEVYNENIV